MRSLFSGVVWLVVFAAAAPGDTVDLKELMAPVCKEHAAPAALAALIDGGKIHGLGVWGVRKLGGEPAAIDDLSMIGSCGKSVTRLLIGRMIDQGRLTPDATLGKLMPDVNMRDDYRGVTVAQLMHHRGGIQPYTEVGPERTPVIFALNGPPREARAAFLAHVLSEAPAAKPGTRTVYSNAGYSLLGHIAERVADVPYEALIEREVFAPLRMKDSRAGLPSDAPPKPHLVGHVRAGAGYRPAQREMRLGVFAPAGMMTCSIADFARLAGTLAAVEAGAPGEYLKPETARLIAELTPGGPSEGVPFFGGDGQYTAAFALWPSRKLAIVVASNAGDNDAVCAALLEAIRAKYAPDARPVPREDGPGAPPDGPRLGISLRMADEGEAEIAAVEPGSAAERAGLKEGDRVVAIDGVKIVDIPQDKLRAALAGRRIVFKIERDGKPLEIAVVRPTE